jgi:hypothetical protein
MKGSYMRALAGIFVSCAIATQATAFEIRSTDFALDDFSNPDGRSAIGTSWQLFSDTVMGGRSTGRAYLVPSKESPGHYVLTMQGEVSLENNGGFVQVRLPLTTGGTPYNASKYSGIALNVRGNGEKYYVHARTSGTRAPWSYYYQEFTATGQWSRIELRFDDFRGENTGFGRFETDRLSSIAIVAAGKEMAADIEVASIALYK